MADTLFGEPVEFEAVAKVWFPNLQTTATVPLSFTGLSGGGQLTFKMGSEGLGQVNKAICDAHLRLREEQVALARRLERRVRFRRALRDVVAESQIDRILDALEDADG